MTTASTPDNPALPAPRIVAFETSGRQGSVVVAAGPHILAAEQLPDGNRHAIELMPAIDRLTRAQGWKPTDIDYLYLSLGPGSFTGLRIAVAMARALAHAIGPRLKIVGVPSLDVIAENAPLDYAFVLPILDAKRAQVFAARYHRQPDGSLRCIQPAALVDPAQLVADTLALAGNQKIALLGEGVDYHRPALFSGNFPSVHELDRSLWPARAQTVHRLGHAMALANLFTNPRTLVPIYIRLPEAEEVWQKKQLLPVTPEK